MKINNLPKFNVSINCSNLPKEYCYLLSVTETETNIKKDTLKKENTNNNPIFDCFYNEKNTDYLLISLSAGRISRGDNSTTREIIFDKWSWFESLKGSLLCVSDPMYALYPKLSVGWYYGTDEISFINKLSVFVQNFITVKNFKKIIIIGASAGGYASILLHSKIKNSIFIAQNPQFVLSKYNPNIVANFEQETQLKLKEDILKRNDLSYIFSGGGKL